MPARPGHYAPLLAALEALPADQDSMRLTFAELAALLGQPLPPSAHMPTYWAHSHAARLNWQRIGWSARLDRDAGLVSFTRRATAS